MKAIIFPQPKKNKLRELPVGSTFSHNGSAFTRMKLVHQGSEVDLNVFNQSESEAQWMHLDTVVVYYPDAELLLEGREIE